MNEDTFITYFIHSLSSFFLKNLTMFFISGTSTSQARIFYLLLLYITSFYLETHFRSIWDYKEGIWTIE
jgi:hypothetical protein